MSTQQDNLKGRTIRATLWSAVDKLGVRGLQMLVYLLLARLLSPTDFGVIGMITIFMAISTMFVDSGFSQALVQNNNPSQKDYSTAFYFNIVVGVGCYLVLFLSAPFIADFFETQLLTPVLRVISITLVTNSLTVVQRAKLLINLDFKTPSIINISTTLISGSASLWAAYCGYGVWALVIQTVGTGIFSMILFWILGRWVPTWEFSKESFKRLWKFGSKLLAAGVVSVITVNLYNLIIGKIYKAKELGYYSTGRQIAEISSGSINEVVNAVTYPVLSSVKDDKERFISIYKQMLEMTAFIIIPSMTLIAVLAEPFVRAIMTDKWLPAVFIIQMFCLTKMFTPISGLNMNILKAYGRSDLFMKLDFVKIPLTLAIMAATISISMEWTVIGALISTVICYFINAYLPGRLWGFGIVAQSKVFSKIFLSAAIMALVTWLSILFILNSWVQLIVGSIVGLVTYITACKVLKINSLYEAKNILFKLLNKMKN